MNPFTPSNGDSPPPVPGTKRYFEAIPILCSGISLLSVSYRVPHPVEEYKVRGPHTCHIIAGLCSGSIADLVSR